MSSGEHDVAALRAQLARSEATVRALASEKVDAVVRGSSAAPVRLRQAQDALRRSEARFRALVENSSDGIALLDAGGTVVYASHSCQRVLGYTPEELIGKNFRELVHPEDLERVQQEVAAALERPGVAVHSIGRVRHEDGSWRVIEGIDTNRFDEPDVGALVVNFRDVTEGHETEEAMHRSERQFRAVFDGSPVAMIIADDEGNFVDVNPAACELLGRTRERAIGMSVADIAPPGFDVWAAWRAFREAGTASGEFVVMRPDGTSRVTDFSATADVTPGHHLSVLRDISEQKRAREHQQVQFAVTRLLGKATNLDEALSQLLVELTMNLEFDVGFLWHVDPAIDRLRLHDSYTLPGLPPFASDQLDGPRLLSRGEGLPGRAWEEGVPVASNDLSIRSTPASSRVREDYALRVALALPIRSAGRVEAVLTVAGRRDLVAVDELLQTAADIAEQIERFTRRKKAEEALRTSEAMLATAERTAHLGSWLWEVPQGELFWSDEYYRILGLERGEVAATPELWRQALHPDDRERVATAIGKAVEKREPFKVEYRVRRPDGSERIIVALGEKPILENDSVVQIFGSVQDVTEQRSLEAQFRQAQKMEAIGQLAGGVAHDFNNLLTAILADTDAVLSEIDAQHPFYEDLADVRQASLRAATLTRQLLAFSRRQRLEPRSVKPSELVAGMQRMLERVIGEDIDLSTSFAADEGFVLVDPGQLEQVVLNLVVNARDAMEHGGQLEIATGNLDLSDSLSFRNAEIPPGKYVTLSVRDTGCGMDEATRARIFEPFFTTKEQGKGTGLGLSTVHGIVHQSGGYISVESAPNRGTLFVVYFPPSERPSEPVRRTSAAPRQLRGSETVLLVEDEKMVRRATKRILQANGYHVLEASGADEALSILGAPGCRASVVITDIVMPGLDGRELADRIADLRPSIRCLYMSGHSFDAVNRLGGLPEHANFIQKPFTSNVLLRKLREILDTPAF